MFDGIVKSTNHVILNEVRMLRKESLVGKNLSQLSTRFFPDESGLPQNDSFGSFYETIMFYNRTICCRSLPTETYFIGVCNRFSMVLIYSRASCGRSLNFRADVVS